MADLFTEILEEIILRAIKTSENYQQRLKIKSPNEVIPNLMSLSLESEDEFIDNLSALGTILHFTEGYLVVKPSPAGHLIELGAKVALSSGKVIGVLDDIIGNVDNPHYVIQAFEIVGCSTVVYSKSGAAYLSSISTRQGTDASNKNDEETESSESEEEGELEEEAKVPEAKKFRILRPPLD